MAGQKHLVCVVGPTAIGKTAMAVSLANMFDSEVISADSRQFYREMSIGTAVPHKDELNGVPHHFIQHISIHDDYSVGQFEKDALKKLDQLFDKHKVLFMAGGSGLYVDAVVNGLDKFPEIPEKIRNSLRETLKKNGLAA
jgi:tRNA dimethylallyltransferase